MSTTKVVAPSLLDIGRRLEIALGEGWNAADEADPRTPLPATAYWEPSVWLTSPGPDDLRVRVILRRVNSQWRLAFNLWVPNDPTMRVFDSPPTVSTTHNRVGGLEPTVRWRRDPADWAKAVLERLVAPGLAQRARDTAQERERVAHQPAVLALLDTMAAHLPARFVDQPAHLTGYRWAAGDLTGYVAVKTADDGTMTVNLDVDGLDPGSAEALALKVALFAVGSGAA